MKGFLSNLLDFSKIFYNRKKMYFTHKTKEMQYVIFPQKGQARTGILELFYDFKTNKYYIG